MSTLPPQKDCYYFKTYGRCKNGTNCQLKHTVPDYCEYVTERCPDAECKKEHRPMKRKPCRTFEQEGFCYQGEKCRFEHILPEFPEPHYSKLSMFSGEIVPVFQVKYSACYSTDVSVYRDREVHTYGTRDGKRFFMISREAKGVPVQFTVDETRQHTWLFLSKRYSEYHCQLRQHGTGWEGKFYVWMQKRRAFLEWQRTQSGLREYTQKMISDADETMKPHMFSVSEIQPCGN